MGVALFLAPLSEHVTYEMLAARLGEEEAQNAVAFADRLKYLSVLFVPLGLLLRWLVVSAFLYFSSVILEAPPNLMFKAPAEGAQEVRGILSVVLPQNKM
jgi:hypothetical protein